MFKVILRSAQSVLNIDTVTGQSKSLSEFSDEQVVMMLRQATRAEVYYEQESTQGDAVSFLEKFCAHFKGEIQPITSEGMKSSFGFSRNSKPSRNDAIGGDRESNILALLGDANVGLSS